MKYLKAALKILGFYVAGGFFVVIGNSIGGTFGDLFIVFAAVAVIYGMVQVFRGKI